jgi:ribosomal protein S20
VLDNDQISTGGWFGIGGELMMRYGVMDEGAFIPEEAEAQTSQRQEEALNAINASLKSGKLKTAAARADKALVRAELDKAWKLNADVVSKLDTAFGKSVFKTLYTTTKKLPTGMRYPRSLVVGQATVNGKKVKVTLADAIGKSKAADNPYQRVGAHAWTEVNYPTGTKSRRDFHIRAQRALHDRLPVIMTWFVDFNAMNAEGQFLEPPATPGFQGGHMTVLEDYQIKDVPGFGTLKAGELVTDPATLKAALDPAANVEFFRVKNSWGTDLQPPGALAEFRGYDDLYLKYLNGPITRCTESNGDPCGTKTSAPGLMTFVLPPSAFATDGVGADGCHDVCVAGASMAATCGSCAEDVCAVDPFCCNLAGQWDAQCVGQAQSVCSASCP